MLPMSGCMCVANAHIWSKRCCTWTVWCGIAHRRIARTDHIRAHITLLNRLALCCRFLSLFLCSASLVSTFSAFCTSFSCRLRRVVCSFMCTRDWTFICGGCERRKLIYVQHTLTTQNEIECTFIRHVCRATTQNIKILDLWTTDRSRLLLLSLTGNRNKCSLYHIVDKHKCNAMQNAYSQ